MAENFDQVAVLSVNGSADEIGLVTNFAMTFNQGAGIVIASLTTLSNFNDKSPLFDLFIQSQPATLKVEITNSINSQGPTTRTIEFQNAMCRNYAESYSMTSQTSSGLNDLMVVVTIEADSATVGETSFPG